MFTKRHQFTTKPTLKMLKAQSDVFSVHIWFVYLSNAIRLSGQDFFLSKSDIFDISLFIQFFLIICTKKERNVTLISSVANVGMYYVGSRWRFKSQNY